MLKGKTVVLGISGGIAAYKIANLASMLKKLSADVEVVMTENATNFINPITFETLTGNKCLIDTFDRNFQHSVEHVSLGKRADIMLIAPATANVIGKMASGIADDMLTTTALVCKCKKLVAPAMNTAMYENNIVQDNLKRLEDYGFEIISPDNGYLACGDVGTGKMVAETVLLDYILKEIGAEHDMENLNVLVTAGPTKEALDPVRFITNHSSGKMGYAIAKNAMMRGANVTLISGEVNISPPPFVKVINVVSAKEMFDAVVSVADEQDIIVKAAAVADYRPAVVSDEKIKKKDLELSVNLEKTDDILKHIGQNKKAGQFICGFSMETQNMVENSKNKLINKNLDMIVANSLKTEGAGFKGDTNIITIITKEKIVEFEKLSKEDVGKVVLDYILNNR